MTTCTRLRRGARLGFAGHHALDDASHALRGGIDGEPDAFHVGTRLRDLFDALQDLLVLVEGDPEIAVQPLIDVGVVQREIAHVQPVVDTDIVVDWRYVDGADYQPADAEVLAKLKN